MGEKPANSAAGVRTSRGELATRNWTWSVVAGSRPLVQQSQSLDHAHGGPWSPPPGRFHRAAAHSSPQERA